MSGPDEKLQLRDNLLIKRTKSHSILCVNSNCVNLYNKECNKNYIRYDEICKWNRFVKSAEGRRGRTHETTVTAQSLKNFTNWKDSRNAKKSYFCFQSNQFLFWKSSLPKINPEVVQISTHQKKVNKSKNAESYI